MVVRSPVARAAAAIGTRTRYRGTCDKLSGGVIPWPLRLGTIFARCPAAVGQGGGRPVESTEAEPARPIRKRRRHIDGIN